MIKKQAVVPSLNHVQLLLSSWTIAHQASLSFTTSRKLLRFMSIELVTLANHLESESEVAQSCPTLCEPIDGLSTWLSLPWDSPGKNTGVGCHFLLQSMKVKSESEVAQLCLTLSDLMDCSLPGSSVHGIFQARVLEWGAIAFSS